MSGHSHAQAHDADFDELDEDHIDEPMAPARTRRARRGRRRGGQRVEAGGDSGFADAINAHRFTRPQTELQQRYRVTGPAPTMPDAARLRAMPVGQLRAMIRQLTTRYGTQNAEPLIHIREAMLAHRGAEYPRPLDQSLLGGFDVWEMDAAMYREYCLLVRYQRQAAANPML